MKRLKYAPMLLALVAFSLAAACGAGTVTEDGAAKDRTSTGGTTRAVTNANLDECRPANTRTVDVRSYAKDADITIEEAARRLGLQRCYTDDLADLERALRNKEAETFAGLWIQHKPEYRFVVLFTEGGEETIRPYLQGEPERFRRLVEVRSGAEATLKELHAAQDKASRLVDELDVGVEGTGIDVQKNRAVIYVTDKARFKAALREEGVRLPEHVGVVEIEGQMRPS